MEPFRRLDAVVACPLPLANVDTDQLIPARFMKQPRAAGYGGFLLHDLRFDTDGTSRGLALDDPAFAGARVLVARRNFGSGSSREAAVYALVDFGFRCVIAPSFGDIFASNAVNNGLLPARVDDAAAERLLGRTAAGHRVSIDLAERTIGCDGETIPFAVDDVWRTKLLNGWDDIDLTLSHTEAVRAFAAERAAMYPWSLPRDRG
ncbi:3-isopropylmalate dehydratase small subunit [Rhodoplanes sp. TEM]|uniref:3-isopropylmalate dehydratase n=1 Tax=Rhodoplanes tepidamans TaxID=200616 RepID=A0ABT5J6F0_RHOTP|nr:MULTISPECIES: 3-isopropylmalate dehydratase small subunit [Rhodoplanes]MDC7785204.1 3-isopropylmalate dehydratase small subunit [Rhodoplanes tepidamans]MDC7986755.1 3-isopropylmalate dehydratase small subunit [Rhodoplanes sp. TEM]MDQ0353462.1 3-isopropylmalate/(R)-2-methylmalate dehydratase small subunit [Rhodoplanes tepidamans]